FRLQHDAPPPVDESLWLTADGRRYDQSKLGAQLYADGLPPEYWFSGADEQSRSPRWSPLFAELLIQQSTSLQRQFTVGNGTGSLFSVTAPVSERRSPWPPPEQCHGASPPPVPHLTLLPAESIPISQVSQWRIGGPNEPTLT